jgi:hypothetical protein
VLAALESDGRFVYLARGGTTWPTGCGRSTSTACCCMRSRPVSTPPATSAGRCWAR